MRCWRFFQAKYLQARKYPKFRSKMTQECEKTKEFGTNRKKSFFVDLCIKVCTKKLSETKLFNRVQNLVKILNQNCSKSLRRSNKL